MKYTALYEINHKISQGLKQNLYNQYLIYFLNLLK